MLKRSAVAIVYGTVAVLSHAVIADERPNVLFIAVDDLNDWIGCLGGHPQALTPNMDRLAARGVLFTNAHCAAPACNPSRAAVFSGRMPSRTGIWSNRSPKLLKQHPTMQLLPTVFAKTGYDTLGTGKLLDSGSANRTLFTEYFVTEQRWSPFTRDGVRYTSRELPSKATDNPRHVVNETNGDPVVLPFNRMPSDRKPMTTDGESFDWGPVDVPESDMGDTRITDWAVQRLRDRGDTPFFLGVGYYRPHIPLFAPSSYFDRFAQAPAQLPSVRQDDLDDLSPVARKWAVEPITAGRHSTVVQHKQWRNAVEAYLACTTFVDHQVGRLIDALDHTSFGDNTIIVLWSDHGWHLGEKQHWGKWTGWERSTRVPLIIVPPKKLADEFARSGSRCDAPVSLIDLFPTLTEMCDVTAPGGLEGESLVPLLRDPENVENRRAVTTFDPGNVSLRTDHYRYVRYSDDSEELYDHRTDPHEWQNLAGEPNSRPLLEQLRKRIPPEWTSEQ
ncbi:MAG: sulfatase [Fuerstiella sp.]|nr:sulfatase [Fuerstiella sp.]